MEPAFFITITPEGGIGTVEPAAELPAGTLRFTTEQELAHIAPHSPLLRLVQLWNGLPRHASGSALEDRGIAVARLWRALQPGAQHNRRETSHTARKRREQCSNALRKCTYECFEGSFDSSNHVKLF